MRLFALALLAGCSTYVVAPGTPIRHDDFVFTVRGIRAQTQTKTNKLYTLDLNVENQARVVNYQWNDRIAYVRQGRGARYYPKNPRQIPISPGQTARVRLKFILPHQPVTPQLRFWGGVFMGDAFNGVRYARAATELK